MKESLHQWYDNSARGWTQQLTEHIQHPREKKGFDIFSIEEEDAFCAMIKLMLVLEPHERATIEEVAGCEWMQRWGLPVAQEIQDATIIYY